MEASRGQALAQIGAKLQSAVSRQGGCLFEMAIRILREITHVERTSLIHHGLVLDVLSVDSKAGQLVSSVTHANVSH